MAETVLNIDPSIDLKQCLLWQYQNSPKLKSLILSKNEWYANNHAKFWEDWYNNVFNLETANDFGLAVWGQILKFSRNVLGKDGLMHYLTTEQYRMVLKGQVVKYGMGTSAPEVNKWLSIVFKGKGAVYCVDSYDMTAIPFVLRSEPDDEIKWLLGNIDFFPRPAGVGYEVRILPDDVFGFNGSDLQPFEQGVFSNDYSDILNPPAVDTYQMNISAPEGATVIINGTTTNYALIEDGDPFVWSVSQSGYITASGSGTINGEDVSISVSKFVINNQADAGTSFINNTEAVGAFFVSNSNQTFNYNVGNSGYIPLSGTITLNSNYTINVSSLRIAVTPSNADVVLNGQNAFGAFFITGNPFDYEYTVSLYGLNATSGSGSVTQTTVVNAEPLSGEQKISGISTDSNGGIMDITSYAVPSDGYMSIVIAAEAGYYGFKKEYSGGYGAKANIERLPVSEGDILKFQKINGGHSSETFIGGSGIALFVNDVVKFVVGGGASSWCGGGGYVGGRSNGYYADKPGYSITGSTGNSKSNQLSQGDGGVPGNGLLKTFGGSGYNALSIETISYSQNQGVGYINLSFEPN